MKQLFPFPARLDVAALLDEVRSAARLEVGDERVVDFLGRFARELLAPATARAYPELASLGFFLRRSEIRRALTRLDGDAVRLPRGLVFHVPPANVDTIFVYSWALSALAGNRNIVRLSSRSGGAADAVLDAMNSALSDVDEVVARSQRIVTYDHDDEVTAALSAAADLRVLWGGDASVRALRRFELAPHARDLTFPDRSSFAVISAAGWAGASDDERRAAVEGFCDDVFWFDQAACASPRGVYWVGGSFAAEFRALLASVAHEKGHVPEPAMAVQNRVGAYGAAADGRVTRIVFDGDAVTTLETPEVIRDWLGAGVLTQSRVHTLDELVPKVVRRDQTITHFGFSREELTDFARKLSGVDRLVPFGSALKFAPVWDGCDLLAEFTRMVTVTV